MKSKIVTQLVMVEQSKASEIKLKGVKILQRAFLGWILSRNPDRWKLHFKNDYFVYYSKFRRDTHLKGPVSRVASMILIFHVFPLAGG